METEQVTPVFKSPVDELIGMCPGPDGGLFVASSFRPVWRQEWEGFTPNRLLFLPQ